MKARIADFLVTNHLLSPLASFTVLLLSVAFSSLPLLFLAGVMAYGWPFLYVYLLDVKEKAAETTAPAPRLTSIRPIVAGAL